MSLNQEKTAMQAINADCLPTIPEDKMQLQIQEETVCYHPYLQNS